MNGLANWNRLVSSLAVVAAVTFVLSLSVSGLNIVPIPREFSYETARAFFADYKIVADALGTAITITGLLLWIFTKVLWQFAIFRKVGIINFPDLSGTWYATSSPELLRKFTSVVSIRHSFEHIRVTITRNQSRGQSVAATLVRTSAGTVRLYVVYYSKSGVLRPIKTIPAVDHGADHSGTLSLDMNDENTRREGWVLEGEYWTNKSIGGSSRGTWGRTSLEFKRRGPASAAVSVLGPEDQNWLNLYESVEGKSDLPLPIQPAELRWC